MPPEILESLLARQQNARQQRQQHDADIKQLLRRWQTVEDRLNSAAFPGGTQDEYGGHDTFFYLAPLFDFYKGPRLTSGPVVLETTHQARLFIWDAGGQIWQPQGESVTLRSDFWHGFAFAGEPVVGLFSKQPGLYYAIGSGHTTLLGVTQQKVTKCTGTTTINLVDRSGVNCAQSIPLDNWWRDVASRPTTLSSVKSPLGDVPAGSLAYCVWNEVSAQWDIMSTEC